jgi:hypothetical protein
MSSRSQIESFFRTLLMGDFEQEQNTYAQVIGGLLSLIPILDQVLDARDISGSIYNINKKGGFGKASTDDIVNFGFAAFGAVPTVGSAFKTIFKPMWKQRRAAKGAVSGGLQAIESMLGMKKGGAITWVRKELLGKWAARTQEAIVIANGALDTCIQFCSTIAGLKGWKDWLVPDSIQTMAGDMVPSLKSLRGNIAAPMERASREIREMLEDLIGEQAAAVVMAAGQRATQASVIPGTRSRSGHNAAALKPQGHIPSRQKPKNTGSTATTNTGKGAGSKFSNMQNTAGAVIDLTNAILGVSGEHIADYVCLNKFGWGGKAWTAHDAGTTGKWSKNPSKDTVGKLSRGGKPKTLHTLYKLTDGSNGTGLDAVWRAEGQNQGKPYAIVEAKASADEDARKFGRIKKTGRQPSIASKLGVSGAVDPSELLEPIENTGAGSGKPKAGGKPSGGKPSAHSSAGKPKAAATTPPTSGTAPAAGGAPAAAGKPGKEVIVQMSSLWIDNNLDRAVSLSTAGDIRRRGYSRHLFFSPLYHPCAEQHAEAHLRGLPESDHKDHDALHYDEAAVKKAVNKRKESLRKKHGNLPSLTAEA